MARWKQRDEKGNFTQRKTLKTKLLQLSRRARLSIGMDGWLTVEMKAMFILGLALVCLMICTYIRIIPT